MATGCPGRLLRTYFVVSPPKHSLPAKLHVFGAGMRRSVRWGKSCIMVSVTLCGDKFICGTVQASSTVTWVSGFVPYPAPTWNDTVLQRTGSRDELTVASCKGLTSPTRLIASAQFFKISKVMLPESIQRYKCVYFNASGARNGYGYDLQQNSRGNSVQGRSTNEDGCRDVQRRYGCRTVQRKRQRKPVMRRDWAGVVFIYFYFFSAFHNPCRIVSCAYSHKVGDLLTQSCKSTTSFPCLIVLCDSHLSLEICHTSQSSVSYHIPYRS